MQRRTKALNPQSKKNNKGGGANDDAGVLKTIGAGGYGEVKGIPGENKVVKLIIRYKSDKDDGCEGGRKEFENHQKIYATYLKLLDHHPHLKSEIFIPKPSDFSLCGETSKYCNDKSIYGCSYEMEKVLTPRKDGIQQHIILDSDAGDVDKVWVRGGKRPPQSQLSQQEINSLKPRGHFASIGYLQGMFGANARELLPYRTGLLHGIVIASGLHPRDVEIVVHADDAGSRPKSAMYDFGMVDQDYECSHFEVDTYVPLGHYDRDMLNEYKRGFQYALEALRYNTNNGNMRNTNNIISKCLDENQSGGMTSTKIPKGKTVKGNASNATTMQRKKACASTPVKVKKVRGGGRDNIDVLELKTIGAGGFGVVKEIPHENIVVKLMFEHVCSSAARQEFQNYKRIYATYEKLLNLHPNLKSDIYIPRPIEFLPCGETSKYCSDEYYKCSFAMEKVQSPRPDGIQQHIMLNDIYPSQRDMIVLKSGRSVPPNNQMTQQEINTCKPRGHFVSLDALQGVFGAKSREIVPFRTGMLHGIVKAAGLHPTDVEIVVHVDAEDGPKSAMYDFGMVDQEYKCIDMAIDMYVPDSDADKDMFEMYKHGVQYVLEALEAPETICQEGGGSSKKKTRRIGISTPSKNNNGNIWNVEKSLDAASGLSPASRSCVINALAALLRRPNRMLLLEGAPSAARGLRNRVVNLRDKDVAIHSTRLDASGKSNQVLKIGWDGQWQGELIAIRVPLTYSAGIIALFGRWEMSGSIAPRDSTPSCPRSKMKIFWDPAAVLTSTLLSNPAFPDGFRKMLCQFMWREDFNWSTGVESEDVHWNYDYKHGIRMRQRCDLRLEGNILHYEVPVYRNVYHEKNMLLEDSSETGRRTQVIRPKPPSRYMKKQCTVKRIEIPIATNFRIHVKCANRNPKKSGKRRSR